MSLKKKIEDSLINALRTKNELKARVLRTLNAVIKNKEIEKRTKLSHKEKLAIQELTKQSQLSDDEILSIINGEIKRRREAVEAYEKAKRKDLALKEKEEIEVLKQFLPGQLSLDRIRELVKETAQELQASGLNDIGKVMSIIMPKVKNRAEGKVVNQIVREELRKIENG